jgi:hypothetical protein
MVNGKRLHLPADKALPLRWAESCVCNESIVFMGKLGVCQTFFSVAEIINGKP